MGDGAGTITWNRDSLDSAGSGSATGTHLPLGCGAQIGRLIVLDVLGQGGMGVVYRAYDPKLDRKVAVKLLRSRNHEERLVREGRAMAQVSHPNIVGVHDVGAVGDRVFVSMELVEGTSLREWLRRPRSWREVLSVFAQAGRGLEAAHARKLIHRDFKPDNVLLGADGRVRVADFGLARALDTPAQVPRESQDLGDHPAVPLATTLTQAGAIMGTPAYMAPEQLAGTETDERTDQFCYCVAFYEALYGERPFGAPKTLSDQIAAVKEGSVQPAPKDTPVPSWLRKVVLRGLSLRAEDRFASMSALLKALPADPDSDSRISGWGRAIFTVLFAAVMLSVTVYLRKFMHMIGDVSALTVGAFFGLALGTAVALAGGLFVWRKELLRTRILRQIIGSMTLIWYSSLLALLLGSRLKAPLSTTSLFSLLWSGCCLILLGMTLRRIFVWSGLVALLATALGAAWIDWAQEITQGAEVLMLVIPAIASTYDRKR